MHGISGLLAIQELLEHVNVVEPTIQFTVKAESEGELPFLLCCCSTALMDLDVYRKYMLNNHGDIGHPCLNSPPV